MNEYGNVDINKDGW